MKPCIPRAEMPQIDLIHLGEFWQFLEKEGVTLTHGGINPKLCEAVQCLHSRKKPVDSVILFSKPVLISQERRILDGNNRWQTWLTLPDAVMPFYQIGLPFQKAVDLMFAFPFTYNYGDGKVHPRTY